MMMTELEDEEQVKVPAWLQGLMAESFFVACGIHYSNFRKNEKNIFCLHCCQSFCPHCLPSHHPQHPLLQVRRYVYQDVIRLDDLERTIDCCFIQPYTINGAKVIFLHPRPQTHPSSRSCKLGGSGSSSGNSNTCFTCDRILQDPFNFCSLSCKVDHYLYQGEDLSSILYRLDESCFGFEGALEEKTPNSILEDQLEYGSGSNYEEECAAKKRDQQRLLIPTGIMLSLGSRRKGAPHRSPLS